MANQRRSKLSHETSGKLRAWHSLREFSKNGVEVKVDGPKRHKVDGPKTEVDGPQKMKLNGPQKCVGGQKGLKVDGLRMRGRSKRDESGRSQST